MDPNEKGKITKYKKSILALEYQQGSQTDRIFQQRKIAALKQFGEVAEKGEQGKTYKVAILNHRTPSDTLVTWLGLVNNLLGVSLELRTYSDEPDFIVRENGYVFVRVG